MLPKEGETFELLWLSLATPSRLNSAHPVFLNSKLPPSCHVSWSAVGLSCMLPEDGESCKLLWLRLAKPSQVNPFDLTDKA